MNGTILQLTLTKYLHLQFEGQNGLNNTSTLNANPSANKYYTFQINGLAYSNRQAVIMETDNTPQSFHASTPVAHAPSTVYPGQDVVVTVTLAGNKSSQEKVFVRYTTDSWSTSSVVEASGSGTTWSTATATIPGSANTPGTEIIYYAYSTTVAANNESNHDLITLTIANNSGSNYSYTVENGWTTNSDGDWTTAGTWTANAAPSNSNNLGIVTINHNVTLDQNATVGSLTINSGKELNGSSSTLTISVGGTFTNNGTFTTGTSTVSFAGSGSVLGSSSTTFNNLEIAGGVEIGGGNTINNRLVINSGGYLSQTAGGAGIVDEADIPTYGADATLAFTGTFDINSLASGWGTNATKYPNNLSIEGTAVTTLSLQREITGNVDIASGATFNSGGNLTLGSSNSKTASLINLGTFNGNITAKRYLTNYTLQTDSKYHFISSPVLSQAIQPEFVVDPPAADVDFYKFDEISNTWINSKEGTSPNFTWVEAFGDNFEVGKGYLVAYPTAPVTKSFSGTLNNNASYVITCTNTTGQGEGWNLIGNPYPAAIDWDKVTLGDGMDDALYYYDASAENYRYYIQLAGETGALGTGSRYIPAMQGFMVHAKSSGTKTVTIEKTDLTHTGQDNFYKSTRKLIKGSLALIINGNSFEDEAYIHFNTNASEQFDGSYDAYKLMSANMNVPMIYTTGIDGDQLAINGLPEVEEGTTIPVSLRIGQDGTYSIQSTINEIETNIFLEDLVTGISTKLNDNPTYSFTASSTDSPDRFLLHFGVVGIGEQDQATTLNAYAYNNRLFVNNSLEQAQIAVYDLQGRLLMQQSANTSGLQSLPLDLPAGVYVVRLSNAQEAKSVKINVQ